ncbi:uncharacterized protein BO87DRAFT_399647 [Aspergillus neoniger CBS 115656]|uniref:Uncharacterized protein n=1 Tax=Aspergillus neoniger (strain CBS 115656) TaxID=1448310 RepID=A0A318YB70_ASPNB|nr:hypothetical protein BO87DRAFT_399647 [Aspergillus neoniger CBS 115656]PYH31214.1 hypothetical protein BO87DRAFT_399647 [Aspergillus neoniger CBS 115656]
MLFSPSIERTGTISEVHRKAQKYGEIRKYNYVPRLCPPKRLSWKIPNIRKAVLGNEDLRRARLQRTGRGGSYDGEAEEASLDERKQCRRLRTVDQQPNALSLNLGQGQRKEKKLVNCSCLLNLFYFTPRHRELHKVIPNNGAQIGTSSPCGPKVAWPKMNSECQCPWGRSSAEVLSPSVGADSC